MAAKSRQPVTTVTTAPPPPVTNGNHANGTQKAKPDEDIQEVEMQPLKENENEIKKHAPQPPPPSMVNESR